MTADRRGRRGKWTTEEAKRRFLNALRDGAKVADCLAAADRSPQTLEYWRRQDLDFKAEYDQIRTVQKHGSKAAGNLDISFPEFSEKYLDQKIFPHQQNIIDVIEGREPTHLHPAMKYQKAGRKYVMVNVPPEHAKSMTVTINYSTYRIATNPNIRIKVVSKTKDMAKEFLYAIQSRLTHPNYAELQGDYAPGGFKTTDAIWKADTMYLGSDLRDSKQKDPTLQALGIRGQIYGKRADIIILDDCVVLENAAEYEKQIRWIQQEVLTRLGPGGVLLILGTRVDTKDLYSEITDPDRYPDGRNPYTILRMPAVLEFAEDPKDWVTLWPKSDEPFAGLADEEPQPDEDGLFPYWDGPTLYARRGVLDPKTWAMVYQQQDVQEDAVFPADLVRGAVNGMRHTGPLKAGTPGHPKHGSEGMKIIASMDPAMVGNTGAVVLAADRVTKKRFILDAACISAPTPAKIRELIETWTERYRPSQWRIEKNAFQSFLTQDERLRLFLNSRGVALMEHHTGSNKWDPNFGVASMATLFGYKEPGESKPTGALIELPSSEGKEGIKALIEELITWAPDTKNKTDMVMALWFAEIAAREWVNIDSGNGMTHAKNPFASRDRLRRRVVVNIDEAIELQRRMIG